MQQKTIIAELIREVHVRGRHIVALVLRQGLSVSLLNETVTLPEPILLGPLPDNLPEGHKRCIKCAAIKPHALFPVGLNFCRECRTKDARFRRLAREAKARNGNATGEVGALASDDKNEIPGPSKKPG